MYYVAFPGDSNRIESFGGTPFFVTHALQCAGAQAVGINLPQDRAARVARVVWNGAQVMLGRGRGGFQYTKLYLNRIWRSVPELTEDDVILSIFQIMGDRALESKAKKVFYFDMTLNQLFREYRTVDSLHAQKMAMEYEKNAYHKADLVICKSEWAARDLRETYGLPADKVKVLVPGANLSDDAEQYLLSQTPRPLEDKVRFLFIGKEPERKGLYRFLDAMALLPHLRDKVVLETVGLDPQMVPEKYRAHCEIFKLGFINKTREMQKFCDVMLNAHIGILLSTAEAGGLSLREFQLAGLPVMAPQVGGAPEWVTPGAGIMVGKDEDAAAIAARIEALLADRAGFERMRQVAQGARPTILWSDAARRMIGFIEQARQR